MPDDIETSSCSFGKFLSHLFSQSNTHIYCCNTKFRSLCLFLHLKQIRVCNFLKRTFLTSKVTPLLRRTTVHCTHNKGMCEA